jgi:Ca-activated chloride channel family protein
LRCAGILLLVLLLARLMVAQRNEHVTVVAVIDRSQSIRPELLDRNLAALEKLLVTAPSAAGGPTDRLAVVDIAEAASISALGANAIEIRKRNTTLQGTQSRLSDGVQMAMAIAPPDMATRILLLSDGNETSGNLKEAARIVASNGIPIDVVPVEYEHSKEVVFERLAAPVRARNGETISLRFILHSTTAGTGRLLLTMNDKPVDLDPDSNEMGAAVELRPGTNVKTVSVPMGTPGVHEFRATYVPDDPSEDGVSENNRATAMTFVAGPGHVLIVDTDGTAGANLAAVLKNRQIDSRLIPAAELPDNLTRLMDSDAVILVNTECGSFSYQQQEMLVRYVTEMGGGLVMTGGDRSFGAGGWIGSPVAQVLPVDCDPPQKKEMPKGALILVIDHSGSMTGLKLHMCKAAAIAAVQSLGRKDLVGVVTFDSQATWTVPITEATDKTDIISRIRDIGEGGGTDMYPALVSAATALQDTDTSIRHVILLTDGRTAGPDCRPIAAEMASKGITLSTVAVGETADFELLKILAALAGGRFYPVYDPMQLPQIFIKEAQVVRRALIFEETFTPKLSFGLSEIVRGVEAVPPLDGYVLTGAKGGLAQVLFVSHQEDPILAAGQAGLGRSVAFTSSIDGRWASKWLAWDGFEALWAQIIRWVGKPAQGGDCEITADIQGQEVTVQIETAEDKGHIQALSQVEAQVITPEVDSRAVALTQTGPGQFQGRFTADRAGSYVVNLRYRKGADGALKLMQTPVTVPFAPEFRDLRDNRPLLEEVAKISGGRMLNTQDSRTNLFEKAGLKYPEIQLPIAPWLMGAWMAVFLLDVAVRRVAVDVVAIRRRVVGWLRPKARRARPDETLDQLKRTHAKMQEHFESRRTDTRGRRYEGDTKAGAQMPTMPTGPSAETPKPKAEEAKPVPPKAAGPTAAHIDQLLKAKRKAFGGDSTRNENPSDPRQEKQT